MEKSRTARLNFNFTCSYKESVMSNGPICYTCLHNLLKQRSPTSKIEGAVQSLASLRVIKYLLWGGGGGGFFLILKKFDTPPFNSKIYLKPVEKAKQYFILATDFAATRCQKSLLDYFYTDEKLAAGITTAVQSSDNDWHFKVFQYLNYYKNFEI